MKPFRLTKMLYLFPVLVLVMIAGVAIGLPTTVEGIAPYDSKAIFLSLAVASGREWGTRGRVIRRAEQPYIRKLKWKIFIRASYSSKLTKRN